MHIYISACPYINTYIHILHNALMYIYMSRSDKIRDQQNIALMHLDRNFAIALARKPTYCGKQLCRILPHCYACHIRSAF